MNFVCIPLLKNIEAQKYAFLWFVFRLKLLLS